LEHWRWFSYQKARAERAKLTAELADTYPPAFKYSPLSVGGARAR
jgi:hypothetical protein